MDSRLTLEVPGLGIELGPDEVWETVAAERRRIAAELHDTVGQALYGLTLALEAMRSAPLDPGLAQTLERARALAREAAAGVRRAIFALPLPEMQARGLGPSVRALCGAFEAATAIEVSLELGPLPKANLAAREAIFRAAREALANTARHSRAERVRLSLRCHKGDLCLEVADDGVGMAAEWRAVAGYGLRSLAAQLARAGGVFEVGAAPGDGTVLRAQVPARPR